MTWQPDFFYFDIATFCPILATDLISCVLEFRFGARLVGLFRLELPAVWQRATLAPLSPALRTHSGEANTRELKRKA